jgi:CDP-ribitol ribitolphosphotransferase / teichoic acid ribitol-phosphate polymerase
MECYKEVIGIIYDIDKEKTMNQPGYNPIITNVFWRRTYLFIEYKSSEPIPIAICQKSKKGIEEVVVPTILETKSMGDDCYRAKINITIGSEGDILQTGWWYIMNADTETMLDVSENVMLNIEEYNRVFRYGKNFYAYVVTFHLKTNYETEENAIFINFMKKNLRPRIRNLFNVVEEAKTVRGFLRKLFFLTSKRFIGAYYFVVSRLTPKTGKRILFMSENRTRIMDNLESIDTRMKGRGLDKQFKISYSFRNIFDGRQNPFGWLKVITQIAVSDFIFVDDYAPIFGYLGLQKKQTLTQVWHAGFGFKLVGYGRFGITGSPHPYVSCHKKYTYALVGNDALREIYSEVFGIPQTSLLSTGMPRLEHFLDKDKQEAVLEKLYHEHPQWKGKTVITFAPTYRGYSQKSAYYDYSKLDFDALCDFCHKENAIILFGKHHFIKNEIPIEDRHKDVMWDVSDIHLNDILYLTDVLITDYSSCFYDFMLLNRPVLFYTYDKNLYSATRGVHRSIDKVAPGKVCETFDELLLALKNKDYQGEKPVEFLLDKCLTNNQLASDKVINHILLKEKVADICQK